MHKENLFFNRDLSKRRFGMLKRRLAFSEQPFGFIKQCFVFLFLCRVEFFAYFCAVNTCVGRMFWRCEKGFCLLVLLFLLFAARGVQAGGVLSLSDIAFCKEDKTKRAFEGSWSGVEFGYLNFADHKSKYGDVYRLSGGWRFSWNMVDVEIPFSNRSGIITGLGYQSDVFYARDAQLFSAQLFKDSHTGLVQPELFQGLNEARFVVRYLTLPMMFEVQSKNGDFAFTHGAVFGWNFYSRLKTEQSKGGVEQNNTYKEKNNFHSSRFKAEFTLRLSYKCFQIYYNVALTPLLETYVHDKIMPFSVGLNIKL